MARRCRWYRRWAANRSGVVPESRCSWSRSSSITAGTVLTASSLDNRAFQPPDVATQNPIGGLVNLTAPVGEADSVSAIGSLMQFFTPGGFPSCTADLEGQSVFCTGLVPNHGYTLTDGAQSAAPAADATGTVFASLNIKRGDSLALFHSN